MSSPGVVASSLPPIIGHRGAAAHAPENTLAGLRCARRLGCEWIEVDVQLTADGALVLCHDPRLDRTTDGKGLIASTSLATIRGLDAGNSFGPAFAGEPMPTLDEALASAAELGLGVDIEIKAGRGREYATAARVAAALVMRGDAAPAVLVSSFQPMAVQTVAELAPQIPRGLLFRTMPRGWQEMARRLGATMIGAEQSRLRPAQVASIRDAGYRLAAFTVNDPARARLLFQWGVTSVFTDAPDIIGDAIAGCGPALARQGATGEAAQSDPDLRQGGVAARRGR